MNNISAWDRVEIARNPKRKTAIEYIECIFDEFIELHGDRLYKDDKSIICGLAKLDNLCYTIIAEQKGRTTKENIERNFGMPNPESYRKAIRFMKQAEKFNRPIVTFIDTKGAYPGVGAEERGQGEAIAKSMFEMAKLKVPVIAIVIGEGSSGGALAIGVANKVYMLENAIYSILSPEGYSSILWKDANRYKEAAEKMKLTAKDLYEFKIIDKIIKEPKEVDENAFKDIVKAMKSEIKRDTIEELISEFQDSKAYVLSEASEDEAVREVFTKIKEENGKIDGIVHSIARAETEDLNNDFIYTSKNGYASAIDVSSYSFVLTARIAREIDFLNENASLVTLTYYGSEKVVTGYNVMGVAKAALESSVRYLANDLGKEGKRVNAISAGPIKTLSAKGIKDFSSILNVVEEKAPLHRNVTIEQVGNVAAFLLSNMSDAITGQIIYADSGYNIMGV